MITPTTRQAGDRLQITGPVSPAYAEVLTPDALAFVATLAREFGPARTALLAPPTATQHVMRYILADHAGDLTP